MKISLSIVAFIVACPMFVQAKPGFEFGIGPAFLGLQMEDRTINERKKVEDFWTSGITAGAAASYRILPKFEISIASSYTRFIGNRRYPIPFPTAHTDARRESLADPAHIWDVSLGIRQTLLWWEFGDTFIHIRSGVQFAHFGEVGIVNWYDPAPRPSNPTSVYQEAVAHPATLYWSAGFGYPFRLTRSLELVAEIGIASDFNGEVIRMPFTARFRWGQ